MTDLVRRSQAVPSQMAALLALAGFGAQSLMRQAALEAMSRPQPTWLTLREASQHCGLSVGFLRRLVQKGKLPFFQDGSIKVRRSDLDKLDGLAGTVQELRKVMKARRG